jgi:hypothetical protein
LVFIMVLILSVEVAGETVRSWARANRALPRQQKSKMMTVNLIFSY